MHWRISTIILTSIMGLMSFFYMNIALAKEASLKVKIGQMILIGFKGTELRPDDTIVKAILSQHIGGVILFDYNFQTKTYEHNIKDAQQLKQLTQQLQAYAKKAAKNHESPEFPLLIGIDYEGGKVNRLKESYGFPKTISSAEVSAMTQPKAKQYADTMAKTLNEAGINLNFAPVVDVNVNAENPVIGRLGRSFSAEPNKVIQYAAIFSKAYQQNNILCVYKHFPGHGSSRGDTHEGFVDVTETWQEYELEPYKQLLQEFSHCPLVMTAHVVHHGLDKKGYPASISTAITKNLLREKLHFKGVVITDDLQMKAITEHFGLAEAVRLAINAGADILVFGNQLVTIPQEPEQIVELIYQDVIKGKISENRINEAYQRIIHLKSRLQ